MRSDLVAAWFGNTIPFFVPLLAALVIIPLLGILPLRQRTQKAAIAAELAAHGASWIIVLGYLAIWIPGTRKIFQDFGVELSSLSMNIIQIADVRSPGWGILLVVFSAGVFVADGMVYSLLWTNGAPHSIRTRFSLVMMLVPLSILLAVAMALVPSLIKFMSLLD
jgi:hypothetical protein